MKKSIRWIVAGIIIFVLIILLILVASNSHLRKQVASLIAETIIKTKVQNLKEKAAVTKHKAESGKLAAEEAEKIATKTEEAISKQKEELQSKLIDRGLSADEIAKRFNSLNI